MNRHEIESWVKEALACSDKEYQLVEVVRTAVELEVENCVKLVEARRQKVLSTKDDPSWTEHFAELQTQMRGLLS